MLLHFCFFKQKTAYEMRISDWSSDVCSSDLTTIVWTTCWLIGMRDGFDRPAFSIALTLALIVMIDAMDLRQKIGRQCSVLKTLFPDHKAVAELRERLGHSPSEELAGISFGAACDRKSVVEGKSVSVRVVLGGRRFIKK